MIVPSFFKRQVFRLGAFLVALLGMLSGELKAATSPYVSVQQNVPLNQSTTDTVNGVLPFFTSHSPVEPGTSFVSLTDATSASEPTGNVILGPDNTWVGVAWDFGAPPAGKIWRLDRFDAWIAAGDNLRCGYHADLSISTNGEPAEFGIIPNSEHDIGMSQNDQYNHIRYDFPTEFVAGETTSKDKYPVKGFRYLRLNSRGARVNSTDWQSRFVEVDIWVTAIPDPNAFGITSVTREPGNQIRITWDATPGRNYDLESKSDLDAAEWNLVDSVTATGNSASLTDSSIGESRRFYRVVQQP